MQKEASTAELSELLGVTEKTIAQWAKHGIMEKLAHGKYDLGESLRNWTAYQKCIHRGCDDPLAVWWIQRDIDWSEAHPLGIGSSSDPIFFGLPAGEELDAAGRITRVIGEAKG